MALKLSHSERSAASLSAAAAAFSSSVGVRSIWSRSASGAASSSSAVGSTSTESSAASSRSSSASRASSGSTASSTPSGSRVRLLIRCSQPFDADMGVDLCSRERSVPQDLLDRPEVRAALEQVCRGRVPQAVRAEVGSAGHVAQASGARRCARPSGRSSRPPRAPSSSAGPGRRGPQGGRPAAQPGRRAHAGPAVRRAPSAPWPPLPSTRTVRRASSTSSRSRPTSSPTRIPVA